MGSRVNPRADVACVMVMMVINDAFVKNAISHNASIFEDMTVVSNKKESWCDVA